MQRIRETDKRWFLQRRNWTEKKKEEELEILKKQLEERKQNEKIGDVNMQEVEELKMVRGQLEETNKKDGERKRFRDNFFQTSEVCRTAKQ